MKLEDGLARKSAALTISSGRPGRPSGLSLRSRFCSGQAFAMSVRKGPGESVFTRTFGPYSSASERLMALSAALALPYATTKGTFIRAPDEETLMITPPSPSDMRFATWATPR